MNIAVCIKQTPDTEARISPRPDGLGIVEDGLAWVISPHDESAIEQALILNEKHGGSITVFSLGPDRADKALRTALAMGADTAVHLVCDVTPMDATTVSDLLVNALRLYDFDLILTGEVSIDYEGAQTPQRIAAGLGWPCVTAAETLIYQDGGMRVRRPAERDEETVTFSLPGVIGVNRRAGEPRYPSFRNIMKARRKKIDCRPVVPQTGAIEIVRVYQRPPRAKGTVRQYGSGIEEEVVQFLSGKIDG